MLESCMAFSQRDFSGVPEQPQVGQSRQDLGEHLDFVVLQQQVRDAA